jgi:predicted nucleic acid-binding protein
VSFLLDTNAISEIRRGRDPNVQAWANEIEDADLRILEVDACIAEEWGRLNAAAPRNTVDSLIAATARVHVLTVVTRNTPDFEGCDVQLLNPWEHKRSPGA